MQYFKVLDHCCTCHPRFQHEEASACGNCNVLLASTGVLVSRLAMFDGKSVVLQQSCETVKAMPF